MEQDVASVRSCLHCRQKTLEIFFWFLVVMACLWGIWGGRLETWDEALTAERSREMFRQRWSMTVHKLGQPDFNKPPLYYWIVAAGFSLLGLGEFAVRLPSALMGLACMFVVYRLARGYGLDRTGGLAAVFLLAVTPHWLNISRQGLLDSGMTLSMLLAMWAYAFHPSPVRGAIWAGLALAFGFWIKNPCALLILPAMLMHSRNQQEPRYWRIPVVLGVALVFGSGWYVHQTVVWGERFTDFYFGYNVKQRFTHDFQGHRSAIDFYFRYLIKESPHILVLGAAVAGAILLRIVRLSACTTVLGTFIVTWLVLIHLAHSKRDPYIVPIYPFMAIIGAEFLKSLRERGTAGLRYIVSAFCIFALIMWPGQYHFRIDKNSDMLAAIQAIPEDCGHVFALGVPPHVPSFYLDGVVAELDSENAAPDDGCILCKSRNSAQLPAVLSNATQVWSGSKGYSVWRIGSPAAP
jgi:4-amino-4-deoxy-L-arabinose transferase-like glycosyltransferase